MESQRSELNAERKGISRIGHLGWLCFGWLPILVGTVALVVLSINPALAGAAWIIAVPAGWLACWGVAVVLHEMGHLITARLLRLNPYSVVLGDGPTVWEGGLFGLHWTLKAVPTTGFVRVWPVPIALLRWRMLLVVGAGPAVNGVLACLAAMLVWMPPGWWTRTGYDNHIFPLSLAVFAFNGWVLIRTLLPGHGMIEGVAYPTDGLQIIRLLVGSHSALTHSRQGGTESSEKPTQPSLWQILLESGKGKALLQEYEGVLNHKGLPAELRLQLLDQYATCVLMLGASEHLGEADRFSEELLRARPNEWTVKGTRGSVLIELGKLEEGEEMLREVVDNDPLAFDRAIAASYLALAQIKRGQLELASAWLDKARTFDPCCVTMKRFEKMLARP